MARSVAIEKGFCDIRMICMILVKVSMFLKKKKRKRQENLLIKSTKLQTLANYINSSIVRFDFLSLKFKERNLICFEYQIISGEKKMFVTDWVKRYEINVFLWKATLRFVLEWHLEIEKNITWTLTEQVGAYVRM